MGKWNFSSNLIYLRQAYGETQEELALSIGFVSKSTIAQYESGKRNKIEPNSSYIYTA